MERLEELLKPRGPWICTSTGLETAREAQHTPHTAALPEDALSMAGVLLSMEGR